MHISNAIATVTLVLATATTFAQDDGVLLDTIVAIVDDGVILQSELDRQTAMWETQLRAQNIQLPSRSLLQERILEQLIVRRLQLQLAERNNIRVSDEDLNRVLDRMARENSATLSQLPELLAADGVDYAQFRSDMREDMMIQQVMRRVESDVRVTPAQVERAIDQQSAGAGDNEYHLFHILIAVPMSATPDDIEATEQRVREVYEKLDQGEDFCALAVAYSDGQQALNCGDLGWRKAINLPSAFAESVPDLTAGEVSEPIRSGSGFHIVRLNEVRGQTAVVEQVHIRHILLFTNEILDDEGARLELAAIKERVEAGEDFGDIARVTSDDRVSASRGGDLGWEDPAAYDPDFRAVIEEIDLNTLSDPFKSSFGWHIVEVIDRREHDATEDNMRRQVYMDIYRRRVEEETTALLRKMREEAYVEIRLSSS